MEDVPSVWKRLIQDGGLLFLPGDAFGEVTSSQLRMREVTITELQDHLTKWVDEIHVYSSRWRITMVLFATPPGNEGQIYQDLRRWIDGVVVSRSDHVFASHGELREVAGEHSATYPGMALWAFALDIRARFPWM